MTVTTSPERARSAAAGLPGAETTIPEAGVGLAGRAAAPGSIGRAPLVLGLVSAGLAALASAVGLLVPGFYHREPDLLAPQLLGQDLVTLALAAPALVVSAWVAFRGSRRAAIATGGLLLYMAYTYATYAFGARFNALFPVYCAILGASAYGLFLLVPRLGERPPSAGEWARMPRRSLAVLLYGVALVFALLWGSDLVPALLRGDAPAAALETQTPTSVVHVLDLAFLLPLGVLAATLLVRRRPWGVPLAGLFLVKALAISVAVLSMAAFVRLAGQPVNAPVAASMALMVALVGLVGWRYARALAPDTRDHGGIPR